MIAVTVGVGAFAEMARLAASRLTQMTGVSTLVLGEAEFKQSGLTKATYLRFRAFDHVDDEDVMYFDADQVCLRGWNPVAFRDREAIVAVRDRMIPQIFADAEERGVLASRYFNTGLLIINRSRHRPWLRDAEEYVRQHPQLPFVDQSALNAICAQGAIPVRFLDRRYNWVHFGEGPLCHEVPVFMAHRLIPDRNEINLAHFAGHYAPPRASSTLCIDEQGMSELCGREFRYICPEYGVVPVTLEEGGTLSPPALPDREGYWFVHSREGTRVLSFASQTRVLQEFYRVGNTFQGKGRFLRPPTGTERTVTETVLAQRFFQYERVGHGRRELELLPGGRVGRGRGGCENAWAVVEEADGAARLLLGGRGRETCRLMQDRSGASWRGPLLTQEGVSVILAPSRHGGRYDSRRPNACSAAQDTGSG